MCYAVATDYGKELWLLLARWAFWLDSRERYQLPHAITVTLISENLFSKYFFYYYAHKLF